MDKTLILLAAGKGSRAGVEKQWEELNGLPVVAHTLLLCEKGRFVNKILLGVSNERLEVATRTLKKYAPSVKGEAFAGGKERRDTVWLGLQRVDSGTGLVVIHDAARPFASKSLFQRVIQKAQETGAAIPAIPVRDTIKEVKGEEVVQTLARERLWAVQTPQAFRREVILEAYKRAIKQNLPITDDASAVELIGHPVAVVEGEVNNEKLTFAEDLAKFQNYLPAPRVGWGFDVHPFCTNRPLMLCGVEIPHGQGLAGHSDADVALHALCDALLGAAGLGDIGQHFPDTDPNHKGKESSWFVEQVVDMVRHKGLRVANADITIIAQQPKISLHISQMRQRVAQLLGTSEDAVNIKATTTEHLGFVGRSEGIAAAATVTLLPIL